MINQEEYEVLKELGDKWKWIARDGFKGELNVYNVRPTRSYFKNWWLTNKWFGRGKTILPYFFPFIQWTDSEPYFIPDLIKEYEKKKYRFRLGNLEISDFVDNSSGKSYTVFSLVVEEDEEMKKDKKWLKDEVARIYDTRDYWSVDDLRDEILDSINELDEPEKVVVSEEVYKHIESAKGDGITLFNSLAHARDTLGDFKVPFPNYKNKQEEYVKAWLAYPNIEVEKEQLYYVVKDGVVILSKVDRPHKPHRIGTVTNKEYIKENPDKLRFTEQEIKDFDERFWSFAVPVEEVPND